MNKIYLNYVKTLAKSMPYKVFITLLLMIFLALTIGFELILLLPILQLVGVNVAGGSTGKLVNFFSDCFKFIGIQPTLGVVLACYVGIVSLHILLNRLQTNLTSTIQIDFITKLSQDLYKAILKTDWLFFSRKKASDFTHALTNELERVDSLTHLFLSLAADSIVLFIYVFLAFQLSFPLTLFVFTGGVLLLIILKGKSERARQIGEEFSKITCSQYSSLIEYMAGMKTTKSYNAEERSANLFSKITNKAAQAYVNSACNFSQAKSWFDIGSIVILSFALYLSFKVLLLSATGVILLIYIYSRIMPKISSMLQNYQLLVSMLPAFDTIINMKLQCEENTDNNKSNSTIIELNKYIRLENVSFSYNERDRKLFNDLNLSIQAFKTTAIVGLSGSGKTTIADLITGLLLPTDGTVLIDNYSLTPDKIKSWREKIGYVAQDTFLFHDTIKENLLWACPDASDEDLNRALKLAACEEFVSLLPKRMETVIGDRGALLSGGERQRLALARALLRRPRLLILDEATNSLDSENEQKIQSAIEELKGQITILVITHRLTMVKNADIIYVLEKGQIKEQGNWDTLINNKIGRFEVKLGLPC